MFDTATLPFYWGRFEPVRGEPDTERLLTTARWLRERGIDVKGHPLVWHTVTAPWLLDLPLDEVERVQRERIRRDVGDFAGLVDTWDAINEAVIMPVFDREDNGITRLAAARGRLAMVRMAFEEARAANPAATLVLNDFDLSPAYEELIEEVLGAGIEVDAIGLQTHMHQGYRGEEQVLGIVDRFARFGLPIHMTETTLLSGDLMPPEITDLNDFRVTSWPSTPAGEERQADEIERHYRSLVGHPAVHGDHVLGPHRRRHVAGRARRPGARGRHAEAVVRGAPPPHPRGVAARAHHPAHGRGGPRARDGLRGRRAGGARRARGADGGRGRRIRGGRDAGLGRGGRRGSHPRTVQAATPEPLPLLGSAEACGRRDRVVATGTSGTGEIMARAVEGALSRAPAWTARSGVSSASS
ncbi:endo-1,4-beta-xylanase [Clavibacter zhangzhiyongii]|uniref:endo-1,4-beta-xylanase n=1 Tax=Clavibacter zhangzhiyongii TaxID=2768071 RepID=UPI0039DF671B